MPALPDFLRGVPWMIHRRSRQCPSLVPAGPFPAVPAPSCASPRGTCSQMCTASLKTSVLFHNYCQQHFPYPHTPRDQGAPSEPRTHPQRETSWGENLQIMYFYDQKFRNNTGFSPCLHFLLHVGDPCCRWGEQSRGCYGSWDGFLIFFTFWHLCVSSRGF